MAPKGAGARSIRAESPLQINLGSGTDRFPGWISVDNDPAHEPDVTHDLNQFPWPFPDGCAQLVRAYHVFEHLVFPLQAAKEVHRILRVGGRFEIQVPHEKSENATRDWSHLHAHWNRKRMEWLASPTAYVTGMKFKLVSYHVVSPRSRLKAWRGWREWWTWGKWGNLTAVYEKLP